MEYVVSARIARLQVIDPGEIRCVQFVLPEKVEIAGQAYLLKDRMRPGTAFLAKPWGGRTDKVRRRMYTRSNSSNQEPGVLETYINHTHSPKADTSMWWQSEDADEWYKTQKGIDIRVTIDSSQGVATVFENTAMCKESNLRLEPDGEWEERRFVCIAFGTGITPFLAYVRFMTHGYWEQGNAKNRSHLTLVASVRHEGQLMFHQELMNLAHRFPNHFRYIPVLTRSWPSDWMSLKGRIIHTGTQASGQGSIDISPLQEAVPDLPHSDLRVCGSVGACRQLLQGLKAQNICPASVRVESW